MEGKGHADEETSRGRERGRDDVSRRDPPRGSGGLLL